MLLKVLHTESIPDNFVISIFLHCAFILSFPFAGVLVDLLTDINESCRVKLIESFLQAKFDLLNNEAVFSVGYLLSENVSVVFRYCGTHDFVDKFEDVEYHENVVGRLQSFNKRRQK